jgi:hypothetical protein
MKKGAGELCNRHKGLKEMAGDVLNQTVVLPTNFSGRLKVSASKPPLL